MSGERQICYISMEKIKIHKLKDITCNECPMWIPSKYFRSGSGTLMVHCNPPYENYECYLWLEIMDIMKYWQACPMHDKIFRIFTWKRR